MANYQTDVVSTLYEDHNTGYVVWIDVDNRMWETGNGTQREVTDINEKRTFARMYGYPEEIV